jgi:hypothetical protein
MSTSPPPPPLTIDECHPELKSPPQHRPTARVSHRPCLLARQVPHTTWILVVKTALKGYRRRDVGRCATIDARHVVTAHVAHVSHAMATGRPGHRRLWARLDTLVHEVVLAESRATRARCCSLGPELAQHCSPILNF